MRDLLSDVTNMSDTQSSNMRHMRLMMSALPLASAGRPQRRRGPGRRLR